jgi:hypothetical protein
VSSDDLLSLLDADRLTLADLDELTAYVRGGRWDAHFMPYSWVAAELSRILGREVSVARYGRDAYLELLGEARRALAGAS